MVLTVLGLLFQRQGFRVKTASRGEDAIALYRQEYADIAIVLLDVCMLGSTAHRPWPSCSGFIPAWLPAS